MKKYAKFFSALVVCVGLLFARSVTLRKSTFGSTEGSLLWLTGSTLKFTRNWVRDGVVKDGFLMLEEPAAKEFSSLASRNIYPSYPPGTLFWVYAPAKILGFEPTLKTVMTVNLIHHGVIALSLSLTFAALLLYLGFGRVTTFLWSLPIGFFYQSVLH